MVRRRIDPVCQRRAPSEDSDVSGGPQIQFSGVEAAPFIVDYRFCRGYADLLRNSSRHLLHVTSASEPFSRAMQVNPQSEVPGSRGAMGWAVAT